MAKSEPKPNLLPASLTLSLIPFIGIGAFLSLFLLATFLYPGGSQADKQAPGFSWLHNYWCNLLNSVAINGQVNPARPFALLATLVLSGSLTLFWYRLPKLFDFRPMTIKLVRGMGILSMLSVSFIFTSYHDLAINLAGLSGLVLLLYIFRGLYQYRYVKLFWLGWTCLLLMGFNNYIYYTNQGLFFLPLLQKLTLACFLGWIVLLNWQLYKKEELAIGTSGTLL